MGSFFTRFTNYRDADSFASRLRKKRVNILLREIDDVYREKGSVRIIDVGGTRDFWGIVPGSYLDSRNVEVVITNLEPMRERADGSRFSYVSSNACAMSEFKDAEFDIAHSNSVIEHVGGWGEMVAYAGEVQRVALRHVVQTPNFWFPIEPHCLTPFFHWLPEPVRIWLVLRFALGHWVRAESVSEAVGIVQSARLLTAGMFCELFPNSKLIRESFLGFTKSFTVVGRGVLARQ